MRFTKKTAIGDVLLDLSPFDDGELFLQQLRPKQKLPLGDHLQYTYDLISMTVYPEILKVFCQQNLSGSARITNSGWLRAYACIYAKS